MRSGRDITSVYQKIIEKSNSIDLTPRSSLMRHKSPIMTQRYAHHYPESLRDGVETLDRISTFLAQSKKIGATAEL